MANVNLLSGVNDVELKLSCTCICLSLSLKYLHQKLQ